MQYFENFSLKQFNSFRLQSLAIEVYFPESIEDLTDLLNKIDSFHLLAGGTNVILKPELNRVIILTKMPEEIQSCGSLLIVDSNVITTSFVNQMIKERNEGFEGLIGIPGRIGGAVIMNAGSGKYSVNDYLIGVRTRDYNGDVHYYTKEQLKISRRYTILQDKKEIVTKCIFQPKEGKINKEEIKRAKLYRKSIPKEPNAGGIFINWHALKSYEKHLIGLKVGDAMVSDKVNIIVNKDNAIFEDVMSLIKRIESIVSEKLILEVKIVGD